MSDYKVHKSDFTSDELSHLSLINNSLESLCCKSGLKLLEHEPTNVRGLSSWGRSVNGEINGEDNGLMFEVNIDEDNREIVRYRVCGSGQFTDCPFFNIKGYSGDDLGKALKVFDSYLACVNSKSVPSYLLREQNVWDKIHLGVPKEFAGQIPIFCCVGMFRINRDFYMLEARRMFWGDFKESIEIRYDGKELNEHVSIANGVITKVNNSFSDRKKSKLRKERGIVIPDPCVDLDGFFHASMGVGLPQPDSRTYHQIKNFEDKLKELPKEWQGDLKAVYDENGTFEPK